MADRWSHLKEVKDKIPKLEANIEIGLRIGCNCPKTIKVKVEAITSTTGEQCIFKDGEALSLYGDPAYPLRIHVQAPFRHAALTPQMQLFNSSMSAVRTSVEWLFGDIINYFKFLDFQKNLKIGLTPVGKMYTVCAILHNALTCLYGNQTSNFFNLDPPTLQEGFF